MYMLHAYSNSVGNLVLCMDNSSAMALVQLELLNQIEKATGKKITDLFQWIVAGGLGALLILLMVYGMCVQLGVCFLCRVDVIAVPLYDCLVQLGKKNISDIRRFYFELHGRVFADPQHDVDKGKELEAMVIRELGDAVVMADVTEPK